LIDRKKQEKYNALKSMGDDVEAEMTSDWGIDSLHYKSIIFERPDKEKSLPLRLCPAQENIDLIEWAAINRDLLQKKLLSYGAILFRNFKIGSAERFEEFIKSVSGELLPYKERSSPRSQVRGNIYTSTDYPPEQSIFLHNENSYQRSWPLKLFFYCHSPAEQGGETPIADTRRVLNLIPQDVRERFEQKKVLYVRNFGNGLGLPWETVFQTDDKAAVERYCLKRGIQYEWTSGNQLRTRHIKDAIVKHPITGESIWFNHAVFFHPTTLDPKTREALLLVADEEDLPYNTFYGDGSMIEAETLDQIRSAYHQETVSFLWQAGDILMLDNMMVAHSRRPYVGHRKVLVGMSELYTPYEDQSEQQG
jgi:alpha-ketoglutarate-dependent taurine dioxygenase